MNTQIYISVVDDSRTDYEFLEQQIKHWGQSAGVSATVSYFSCGGNFIKALTEKNHPCNVVFLDIMMPETDGMEIAEVLNRDFPQIYKVMYSSTIEYISKGYIVNAVRYIIKDSAQIESDIEECLNYLKNRIWEDTAGYYDISSARIIAPPIPIKHILYITVEGHYVLIKTTGGDVYKQRKTLREMEEALPSIFILCNRKTLINVRHIKQIAFQKVIMRDGASFKVTVTSAEKFLEQVSRLS